MSDVAAPGQFDAWPDCQVHVEWGQTGARLAAARGDIVVVVDVLSFSTTLAVAVARDFTCLVYSGAEIERMGGAQAAGAALGARPLSKSRRVPPGQLSLSPQSLLTAERGQRVLFTSLNGAAAVGAATDAPALLVGGLRNAGASAAIVARLLAEGVAKRVTVVASGEHWNSVELAADGLRPSLEDWLGAGAICARLQQAGHTLSAEAAAAAGGWVGGAAAIASCVSARELIAAGFGADVALALEVDVSDVVPVRVEDDDTGRMFAGRTGAEPDVAVPATDALLRRFRAQVTCRPDAVALVTADAEITYAELDRRAARVTGLLAEVGVRPGELVGVRLPRGGDVAAAILGVLGHGCGYLPIDPAYPAARQDYLVRDAGIRHVVEHGAAETGPALVPVPDSPPGGRMLPDGTAYVIYTSGSTGRPKGVPVTQRQVAALMTATEELFDFGLEDRWSLVHSYSFDFSVWEMWGAWWHGGTAVVVPVECTYDAARLAELLAARRITVLNQVPSMFGQLVAAMEGSGRSLPALRHIVFGGEAVNICDVRRWQRAGWAPQARLANMYGITETTVHVTYRSLDGELPPGPAGTTPIGRPLAHLRVVLLDDGLRPVPPGAPGQIAVAGAGVGQGYLDRPEQTAERFVYLPDIGGPVYLSGDWAVEDDRHELHYIGRKDDQIQLRGLRVERGEVAAAVLAHPGVAACAITAPLNAAGDPVLVAHVVPQGEPGPSPAELRKHVAGLLPRAMVPARFVNHRELPLTAHGKVDLAALDRSGTVPGPARR